VSWYATIMEQMVRNGSTRSPCTFYETEKWFLIDVDSPAFFAVQEYFFNIYLKMSGNLEGEIKGRDVFYFLYCKYGLPRNADYLCEVFLGKIMHRPKYLDLILHRSPSPRISGRNRS